VTLSCQEMIESITESPAKAVIVRLLAENLYLLDNARGLAAWAALPESEVASAADELADLGVLKKYGQGVGAVYRLTNDGGYTRVYR